MRLIIVYTSGFGSADNVTQPFIYESVEKFLSDFETACKNAFEEDGWSKFQFGGDFFFTSDFISQWGGGYAKPTVYTVDKWFSCVEDEE